MRLPEHSCSSSFPTENESALDGPQATHVSGWTLHDYSVVESTNLVAANMPAWNAVRSARQTAGRGRFQRQWISNLGGLWLSAVVPLDPQCRRVLPLAMGAATIRALQQFGVEDLRMRWPNDVLVGARKLAGLLIDQFQPSKAVIGIGINVHNQPEAQDTTLNNRVTRLENLIATAPSLDHLTSILLAQIRGVLNELSAGLFGLPALNAHWRGPRTVELELNHDRRKGLFTGVDADGRLRLAQPNRTEEFFEPHQVRRLTEIETDP